MSHTPSDVSTYSRTSEDSTAVSHPKVTFAPLPFMQWSHAGPYGDQGEASAAGLDVYRLQHHAEVPVAPHVDRRTSVLAGRWTLHTQCPVLSVCTVFVNGTAGVVQRCASSLLLPTFADADDVQMIE